MIEEALVTRAAATAGLTALIGAGASMRFYPQQLPQKPTYPAVTYTQVSAPREQAMGSDPGIVQARVQLSAWGSSAQSARDVAEQLRAAFERWRGTVGGVVVLDTLDWSTLDAPPELVAGVIVRQRICECRVIYRE